MQRDLIPANFLSFYRALRYLCMRPTNTSGRCRGSQTKAVVGQLLCRLPAKLHEEVVRLDHD